MLGYPSYSRRFWSRRLRRQKKGRSVRSNPSSLAIFLRAQRMYRLMNSYKIACVTLFGFHFSEMNGLRASIRMHSMTTGVESSLRQTPPGDFSKSREAQEHEPIAFVGTAFERTQQRWKTFEKKAFENFKTFEKLGYLFFAASQTCFILSSETSSPCICLIPSILR